MGAAGFSQNVIARDIVVGAHTHQVRKELLNQTPPILIVQDKVLNPAQGIGAFTITSTFTEEKKLKFLTAIFESEDTFMASGEFEWSFCTGERLNMYGKTTSKHKAAGMTEYAVSFFMNLEDFCARASTIQDRTVLLRIYSKEGEIREFELPSTALSPLPMEISEE
ncbi:MAG TPA: hypothetical protein VN445_09180 [Rectinemataceae bacterium]|nr:hypothetical protein [Rectinemataceae bacterium]